MKIIHYYSKLFTGVLRSGPWGFVWDAALKAAGFRVLRGVDPDTPLAAWNTEQAELVEYGKGLCVF